MSEVDDPLSIPDLEAKKPTDCTPEFAALVERVRAIDPDAAVYMSKPHPELKNEIRNTDNLDSWAYWSSTPQGGDYWFNISCKLSEI